MISWILTIFSGRKDGRVQKKCDEETDGIPIEKKTYKINELSALQGKLKKVDTELSVDEETNEEVIEKQRDTELTEFFSYNRDHPATTIKYVDFP